MYVEITRDSVKNGLFSVTWQGHRSNLLPYGYTVWDGRLELWVTYSAVKCLRYELLHFSPLPCSSCSSIFVRFLSGCAFARSHPRPFSSEVLPVSKRAVNTPPLRMMLFYRQMHSTTLSCLLVEIMFPQALSEFSRIHESIANDSFQSDACQAWAGWAGATGLHEIPARRHFFKALWLTGDR